MTKLYFDESDLVFTFIRSPGPGGQNVNKVATGVQLHFYLHRSKILSNERKDRLQQMLATRLTQAGAIVIKATRFRTQERNKQDAIARLQSMLEIALFVPKKRKKTKPSRASVQKRLTQKKRHGEVKQRRRTQASDD
jgi:ribosome-associated protein